MRTRNFLFFHFLHNSRSSLSLKTKNFANCGENGKKSEFRVLIKHYFLREKTITETKAKLDKYYRISLWPYKHDRCRTFWTPSRSSYTRNNWKNSQYGVGRSKIESAGDCRSHRHRSVVSILKDYLGVKKLSARWVPRLLTIDHKRNRVTTYDNSEISQITLRIAASSTYSPDLAPSEYFLLPNLKK